MALNGWNESSKGTNGQMLPRSMSEAAVKQCDTLVSSTSVREALEASRAMNRLLGCSEHDYGIKNFFKLRTVLNVTILSKWNRVNSILKTLDDKANRKEYTQARGRLMGKKVLVIGGGLAGLRACIELLLLGAQVICIEKRDEFSRNNVIHLWPNVINDMISFEAKRFYGQFCVGSIDHISIRQLQTILLKIALIYGLRFVPGVSFNQLCVRLTEPKQYNCDSSNTCDCCCHRHGLAQGAHAHFESTEHSQLAAQLQLECFDVVIGCDGRRHTFAKYFPRNSRRGKLAIGLTANFVNKRTEEEVHCAEISGRSRIYHRDWFKGLEDEQGIELENLVYYRDDTHYFVMTATKLSLLKRGVLREDFPDSHLLLDTNNIDTRGLMRYSRDAAEWSSKLRNLEFALNSNNRPDVALFDFTAMYSAMNASCAKRIFTKCCSTEAQQSSKYVLIMLCGDSLLEPFWPTGSGAGRGFLSAMDTAWTVAQWFTTVGDDRDDIDGMLDVISKREYIYRLLAQTTPENTTAKGFGLDPQTRYKNVNFDRNNQTLRDIKDQVRHLIIDKGEVNKNKYAVSYETKRARRATVGINVEDVARAKAINSRNSFNAFDFDDYGYRGRSVAQAVNAVPSSSHAPTTRPTTTTTSTCDNCDNLQVYEYKPRNASQAQNDSTDFSQYFEYRARNHQEDGDGKPSRPTSDYAGVYGRNGQTYLSQSTNKLDDYLASRSELSDYNRLLGDGAAQRHRARRSYLEERRNVLLRGLSDTRSEEPVLLNKPKKSSDIMEKAMSLEQKFDDTFKKPFEPKLTKVGKIEEEDWNVKMWSSADAFAPRVKEKVNIVYDNSKELLQSRIQQLSNNMNPTTSVVSLTPKNRVTNDYVNLMQTEINLKFAPTKDQTKEKKSTTLTSTTAAPLAIHSSLDLLRLAGSISSSKQVKPNPAINNQLLRPSGMCKRCSKCVAAIDKAMVKGDCYHKTCLTCKTCFVALRIDELDYGDDDFLCKLCRSRRDYSSVADSRSNFFTNSLNLSMIEAKKNFLTNVDQIDFRERAEFEINDAAEEEEEVKSDEMKIDDAGETPKAEEENKVETTSVENVEGEEEDGGDDAGSQASSMCDTTSSTGSGSANAGDTNYTDDERSDTTNSEKGDGEGGGRKDSIDSNAEALFDNKLTLPAGESKNERVTSMSMFARLDLPTIDCEEGDERSASRDSPPSPAPNFVLDFGSRALEQEPAMLPVSHGQASPLLFTSLDLETNNTLDSFGEIELPRATIMTESLTADAEVKPASIFKYPRYGGQFTEKFYRTHSQPSLFEQMNKLDEKLKKRVHPRLGISRDQLVPRPRPN